MTIGYGPRVVTDGLVLALDAADISSYPGSGTTWTDLSGNGNNGSLVNGVGYSGDNGGSLVFDGTNDYVTLNNFNITSFGVNFTISCWIKLISGTNNYIWDQSPSTTGAALRLSSTNRPEYFIYSNGETSTTVLNSSKTLSQNIWYNIVCVSSTNLLILYINGESETQGKPLTSINQNNSDFIIGTTYDLRSAYFNNFSVSNFSVYDRSITPSEIQQNFNALRGRFGI